MSALMLAAWSPSCRCETLIEDQQGWWVGECHDRVAEAILRAKVITDSSRGRRDRWSPKEAANGWQHRGERKPVSQLNACRVESPSGKA